MAKFTNKKKTKAEMMRSCNSRLEPITEPGFLIWFLSLVDMLPFQQGGGALTLWLLVGALGWLAAVVGPMLRFFPGREALALACRYFPPHAGCAVIAGFRKQVLSWGTKARRGSGLLGIWWVPHPESGWISGLFGPGSLLRRGWHLVPLHGKSVEWRDGSLPACGWGLV